MLHPSARATVQSQVGKDLAFALWRHSKRKGTFSRHETQARTLLREKGLLNASDEVAVFFFFDTMPGTLTRRGPDAFVHDVFDPLFGQYTNPRGLLAEWSYSLTPIRGLGWRLGTLLRCRLLGFRCLVAGGWSRGLGPALRLRDSPPVCGCKASTSPHGSCLGLPLVIVSQSREFAALKSTTSRRPCGGFQSWKTQSSSHLCVCSNHITQVQSQHS